jgi:DNA repair exonuclease SbcCD ATPase subunit
MQIKLHYVKFKNILSYGNVDTEVRLDQDRHTIITAKNGQGKSSIIEAICYGLYGKPYRSIKVGQLVNSINKKALLVTIEFSRGNDVYRVVRGQKPSIFEIYKNDQIILEDAASRDYQSYLESDILGINFKTFKQIIVMGSANYTPFMNLSAAERRNITEEVLDISVFSNMQDIAKQKVSQTKSRIDQISQEIVLIKGQIESQKNILDSLINEANIKNEELLANRSKSEARIVELTNSLTEIESQIDAISDTPDKQSQVEQKKNLLSIKIAKIEQQFETLSNQLAFYDNQDCPTCGQPITEEHREHKKSEHTLKTSALDSTKQQMLTMLDEFNQKYIQISESVKKHTELIGQRKNIRYALDLEKQALAELNTQQSTESLDLCKKTLKALVDTLVEKTDTKNDLLSEIEYYKTSVEILKDNGIKAKVIATFIPILNKMINEYLQRFDMFVSFELDETFNESIKSRDRDLFTYNSFSEGEKAKIDAAILFAWRRLAMSRNSISTNILIFDETLDRGMDEDSVNIFIDILGSIEDNVNSIVISHRNVVPELFDRHITVDKVSDFSILQCLT